MMQAEFAAVGHFLLTPNKAWKDQPTFTIDEVRTTNRIGNKRIHIERGFERGQARLPALLGHTSRSDRRAWLL